MINIVLIAPYEQSRAFIQGVVDKYVPSQPVNISVHVFENDTIPHMSINGDVIIARGYNMQLIKDQSGSIPVVPLDVSGYDIIKAASDAQRLYNSQKIAIIGPGEMIDTVENIRGILNVTIQLYRANIDEIDDVIAKAREDGCDCLVGGYAVYEHCKASDNKVLIKTGKSTVISSLNAAIRAVNLLREQQRLSARFKALIDYSRDGIISMDESGTIVSINRNAQGYLYLGIGAIGKKAEKILPFAKEAIAKVQKTGKKLENEIHKVNDRDLTVDYIPLSPGKTDSSVVMFIRMVDQIWRDESLLRKKIVKRQSAKYTFDDIIQSSSCFGQTIETAKLYSRVDSPVLIIGESGTGKELMAQSIHNYSDRKNGPFIGINCAALTESLLESELFGYVDGAFTGALKGGREGLFEAAHGGTLFLDEISEIPISFQSKLLRVLQENEVRRVGSHQVISVDVRILSATNRNLKELVDSGQFRQDLYFRLNVLPLHIPPLRARPEDILNLFDNYLKEYCMRYNRNISVVTGEARKALIEYPWHGNVRELKNIAERICVLNRDDKVTEGIVNSVLYGQRLDVLTQSVIQEPVSHQDEDSDELSQIRLLLQRYNGNKSKVAQHLGIDRSTLWRKLKKLEGNDAT